MKLSEKRLNMLSKRIREARESCGLSQAQLGESIGVSDKSISAYEKGRAFPPVSKLQQISRATKFPLTYFTDETDNDAALVERISALEKELQAVKKLLKNRN